MPECSELQKMQKTRPLQRQSNWQKKLANNYEVVEQMKTAYYVIFELTAAGSVYPE